jgi:hypothetical protein
LICHSGITLAGKEPGELIPKLKALAGAFHTATPSASRPG